MRWFIVGVILATFLTTAIAIWVDGTFAPIS